VPAEQALAIVGYTSDCLDRADAGEAEAQAVRRILTPMVKLRACRDARKVTGDGMEVRGGCGYVEEFIEPRLLRESHLGSIWEGTTNIIALDVIRAARKAGAHEALAGALAPLVETAPEELRAPLADRLGRAVAFTGEVAREGEAAEPLARQAATGPHIQQVVGVDMRGNTQAIQQLAGNHLRRRTHGGQVVGSVPFVEQRQKIQQALLLLLIQTNIHPGQALGKLVPPLRFAHSAQALCLRSRSRLIGSNIGITDWMFS